MNLVKFIISASFLCSFNKMFAVQMQTQTVNVSAPVSWISFFPAFLCFIASLVCITVILFNRSNIPEQNRKYLAWSIPSLTSIGCLCLCLTPYFSEYQAATIILPIAGFALGYSILLAIENMN